MYALLQKELQDVLVNERKRIKKPNITQVPFSGNKRETQTDIEQIDGGDREDGEKGDDTGQL